MGGLAGTLRASNRLKRVLLMLWKNLPLSRSARFWLMWRLNSKFLVGVIGVVLDSHGRVLLLKHVYRTIPWGLPSGWAKRGEQPGEALLRELWEEVGLKARLEGVLDVRADRLGLPRLDVVLLCRAEEADPEVKPRDPEIEEAGFFQLDDFPHRLPCEQSLLVREALGRGP